MKKLFFVFLLFFISLVSSANEGYSIKIKIEDYPDSSLLLTSYHGDKIRLIDTAYLSKKGEFRFEDKHKLPGGIYMAISPLRIKLFEFIVNDDQFFSITTDTLNYTLHAKIKGSNENEIFYDYLKFNENKYQLNKALSAQLKENEPGSTEFRRIKTQIDSVNKILTDYKYKVIEENPDLFVAKLFTAMREVEVPDSIINSDDSTAAYKYLKKHYWDYFDLSDERFLRTPLVSKKVKRYFDQLVVMYPDSVISSIDEVIGKARPSEEVVGYLVWHFVSAYQNPKYMGFEKVFIHLVDAYFTQEDITLTTPSVLKSLVDRAEILRPLQLGEPAPNLLLIDTMEMFRSFREINADFIVLFFWDFDCSHCKKETKYLQDIYQNSPFDFEVFAINVNGDHEKWKKSIVDRKMTWFNVNGTLSQTADFHDLYDIHGSPVIYLLDKDKKIIAKRISADQIIPLLDNYSKKH